MKQEQMEHIHQSLVNDQRRQMVRLIDEYGTYDFWEDYRNFLADHLKNSPNLELLMLTAWTHYTDAVISYHRIKAR